MKSNGPPWKVLGIILRTPDPDRILRELEAHRDTYIVYSKVSRLKLRLVEEAFE